TNAPSIRPGEEAAAPTRTRRERRREHGENWQRHDDVSLLGHELNLAIANVLSAETGRVTDTKPTVKQHVEPDALPGADRPSPLIGREVALAPGPKSGSLLATRSIGARRRAYLYQPRLLRPAK